MKHSKGFSLIELMIVVALLGILGMVSMGYYRNYVISSNRTEGRSALQTAAGTLEKCRSLYGSYNDANCNYADFTSETGLYDISEDGTITAASFTLTATPAAGGSQTDDTVCTSMTLTHTGVKSGTGTDNTECW